MLLDCQCGQTNRIPSLPKKRYCCGNCQHEFTPDELVKARLEPPPTPPDFDDLGLDEDD